MSGLEFTARLVEALAWPAVAMTAVVVFRAPLRSVIAGFAQRISSLRKVSALGADVEFDPANEALTQVLEDPATPLVTRAAIAEIVHAEFERSREAQEAVIDPRVKVRVSRQDAQRTLGDLSDDVLYEAEALRRVEQVVQTNFAGRASFAKEIAQVGYQFDGAILPTGSLEVEFPKRAIFVEVLTANKTNSRYFEHVARGARAVPDAGGLICVVVNSGSGRQLFRPMHRSFERVMQTLGMRNTQLLYLDNLGDEADAQLLEAIRSALDGAVQ